MVEARDESDQSDTSSIISSATHDYEIAPRYDHLLSFMLVPDLYGMSEPASSPGRKIHDFITISDESDEESDPGGDDIEYLGTARPNNRSIIYSGLKAE